jgi:hypothetical protein
MEPDIATGEGSDEVLKATQQNKTQQSIHQQSKQAMNTFRNHKQ